MIIKALDWRVTVTLAAIAPIINWCWYLLVTHNALRSFELALSSVLSVTATHLAHRWHAKRVEGEPSIDSPS